MVWRSSVSAMVAVAVGLIAQAQAFDVTLVNSCSESIVVFDSKSTETLQVGGSSTHTVSPGAAYVYRKGTGGQATLAEFSADNNAAWYDISIIPTGEKSGPGNCGSLEECMKVTGGVGFNVPMSIEPSQPDGNRCVTLTCMENGCSDAYQFPADDTKTHSCPSSVDFTVTFCPGGSSGAQQSVDQTVDQVANEAQSSVQQYIAPAPTTAAPTQPPTEAPTQPPTESPTQPPTLPPTEAPTLPPTEAPNLPPTEAPTLPPTEVPTLPPTEAPSASSASASSTGDVDAGDSQWSDFIGKVGAHNETSSSNDVDVGDDSGKSESSSKATTQPSITAKPDPYQKAGVETTPPSALQTAGDNGSVQQVNTQSSDGGSGGTTYIVLCIGAAVGAVAVAAIVVIRKKKQAFDEMDNKTPVLNTMRDGPTDHSVLMTATNHTSAVL
ncbi:Thaumatin-like protein [Phytophthora citrophthora]|uniref:Thaumatin-like protein n=1 Tax=Phytophthora citrophthora TaxID=4793 RepID=A0AAD9LFG9_9STRA|nr:Thaumatin-like protein [Phytophthora citrophthora]